jgi:hypothetical protein
MILPEDVNRQQDYHTKVCQFPECTTKFAGRGKAKYCDEHRKQKYKKILYQTHSGDGIGDNAKIEFKEYESKRVTRKCGLDGCGCEYEVLMIPNQSIYAKFCENHRNAYKRINFTKQRERIQQEVGNE